MNFFKKFNENRKQKSLERELKAKEAVKQREIRLNEAKSEREKREKKLENEIKEKADTWKAYLFTHTSKGKKKTGEKILVS